MTKKQQQNSKNNTQINITQKDKKIQQAVHGSTFQNKLNWLWKTLLILVILFFGWITISIHRFQTDDYYINIRKGSYINFLIIGLIATIIYIIYDRIIHILLDQYAEKNWLSLKYQGQSNRKRRATTMIKLLIAITYYLTTSIVGYNLLMKSTVLPTWLGGNGKCINMMLRLPYQPQASQLAQLFLCISFGKHFARLILHMFVTQQGSYYSFTLHHFVSIFLVFFGYLMNFWTIGIFVIFIHDCSDLANSITRFYIELRCQKDIITGILVFMFAVTWIGCRNIIFPLCFLYPVYQAYDIGVKILDPKIYNDFYVPGLFGTGLLFCLQILHIVWTITLLNYIKVKIGGSSNKKDIKKQK